MIAALVVLVVVEFGAVAYLVLRGRRPDPDMQALIALVDRLCQRVQAPQAAILEHDEKERALRDDEYAPPAVSPDDDEGYWASRDKLAELMMEKEIADGGRNGR